MKKVLETIDFSDAEELARKILDIHDRLNVVFVENVDGLELNRLEVVQTTLSDGSTVRDIVIT